MRRTFFTLIIALLTAVSFAQVAQDCGAVDCPGRCGRFIDQNGDGFCDRGRLSTPAPTPATPDTEQSTKDTQNTTSKIIKKHTTTPPKVETNKQNQQPITQTVNEHQETLTTTEVARTEIEPETETPTPVKNKSPYSLILISCLTIGGYIISSILVISQKMKKATHRKIWNFILLFTGLASCLLGFFLVIQINYNLKMEWLWTVKLYHVQFGIAMTIVMIIHILWHINYWKTYFRHNNH